MDPITLEVPGCAEVADRLSELLDGELDEGTARAVVLHLAFCPACARFAAELAATIDVLHALPRPGAGPSCPLE